MAAVAAALVLRPAVAQPVPTDAQPTCVIAPAAFAAMFDGGRVTLNGSVRPADSTVNLDPPPFNCPFFVWSEQMYLWLTSPAPGAGGRRVMFSPEFYTVSPTVGGRRNFIANDPARPIQMRLRAAELGPNMRPALVARTGQIVEVAASDPQTPPPPVVRLQSGVSVRLGDVRRTGRALQFFDTRGRQVQVRRPALTTVPRTTALMQDGRRMAVVPSAAAQTAIQARRFEVNGIPIFVDANNNVIDVEPGQADGGVLLTQNGSLIYYIVTVNDVFAYHRTMQGAAVIPRINTIAFPRTVDDADAVAVFAASRGHTIANPRALAIETKSSWVEASAVANPDDYIQVEATVPVFERRSESLWVQNGERTVRLVMVGLHVVGSTFGHGEMVWSTFEHIGNAPNGTYSYNATTGERTVAQNTAGSWVFSASGAAGPFNDQHAKWNDSTGNIEASLEGTPLATPTSVLRTRPWGSEPTDLATNTQVIAINASVIGQLVAGDVRRNYFQLGSTWTIGGAPPNATNQVGTNQLANATMETFGQPDATGANGTNCFSCHKTNTVSVSHIYRVLNPLP